MPECIFWFITAFWATHSYLRKRHSTFWVKNRRKSWHKSIVISILMNSKQLICIKLWDSTSTSKKTSPKQKQKKMPMTSSNRLQSAINTQSTLINGSSHLVNSMSVTQMSSTNFWKTMMQRWLCRVNWKILTFDSSILLDNIIIIMIRLAALVRRAVYPGV